MYHLPPSVSAVGRLPRPLPDGIPSEGEYVAEYCAARRVPVPRPEDWAFYLALSLYRCAAILAGVHTRALHGNAAAANAASVGTPAIVHDIATTALALLHRAAGTSSPADQATSGVTVTTAEAQAGDSASPAPAMSAGLGPSARCEGLLTRLRAFIGQHVARADAAFEQHAHGPHRWDPFPDMESLKHAARTEGLWNLWISRDLGACMAPAIARAGVTAGEAALLRGPGLSNLDYAYLAREMGQFVWCPEVFNCSAPDTGNMEVLGRYGSPAQQAAWLVPLLRGDIRSCFAMTEAAVASSDATNVQGALERRAGACHTNVWGVMSYSNKVRQWFRDGSA